MRFVYRVEITTGNDLASKSRNDERMVKFWNGVAALVGIFGWRMVITDAE